MPSVLITGTSTGIGQASAVAFAGRGYRTLATMRNLQRADGLLAACESAGVTVELRELDIADAETMAGQVERILAEGPIDVLVNNAGIAGAMPLELVPDDQHKAIFEANYFGQIRMIQAVLPQMRERGTGTIVNLSSVAGRIAVPNQIPYSASKWAFECASEALAHEVRQFGIRIRIIEPGVVMTKIFENAADNTVFDRSSPYVDIMRRNGKFYAAGFKTGVQAEAIAKLIVDAAESDSDQLRYLIGADAEGWVSGRAAISDEEWVSMGDAMSDEAFNALFKQRFGIDLS